MRLSNQQRACQQGRYSSSLRALLRSEFASRFDDRPQHVTCCPSRKSALYPGRPAVLQSRRRAVVDQSSSQGLRARCPPCAHRSLRLTRPFHLLPLSWLEIARQRMPLQPPAGRHKADRADGLRAVIFEAAERVRQWSLKRSRLLQIVCSGELGYRRIPWRKRGVLLDFANGHGLAILLHGEQACFRRTERSPCQASPICKASDASAMHQKFPGHRMSTHSSLATSLSCVSGRLMPSRPQGM